MEDRLKGQLSLAEAARMVQQLWDAGPPDLKSIGSRLREPTLEAYLELAVIDADQARQRGYRVELQRYAEAWPLVSSHLAELQSRIDQSAGMSSTPCASPDALLDLFSQKSLARTKKFEPNLPASATPPRPCRKVNLDGRELPESIGNFVVEGFLGRGTFGYVLAARDKRLGRKVAIKVKEDAQKPGLSDDFLHEARSICRMEHPHIVRLFQADETEDGIGYLVYEFVDGEMLSTRIERGDYTLAECVKWIAEIAEALDYAHRRAVIHRDVSPRNIMIARDGTARLLDFGLSRVDDAFYRDDRDMIVGTIRFISPEQASGNPHWATSYADIFSLGCVLYYAMTQRLPFSGKSEPEILERIQKAPPAAPRSVRDDIPATLEEVCLRALAKQPEQRYATGADMSAALLNALMAPAPTAQQPVTHQPVGGRSIASGYSLLALGLLLTIAGGAVSLIGLREWWLHATSVAGDKPKSIDQFDLLVTVDGPPQKSLIFNDDAPALSLDKTILLTIKAQNLTPEDAQLWLFNYERGGPESGRWLRLSVDPSRTTLEKDKLRPGPNILLLIHDRPDAQHKLPPMPIQIGPNHQLAGNAAQTANRNVYLFSDQTTFSGDLQKYVVERAPTDDGQPAPADFLGPMKAAWGTGNFHLEKGDFGSSPYCGVAFWVDARTTIARDQP